MYKLEILDAYDHVDEEREFNNLFDLEFEIKDRVEKGLDIDLARAYKRLEIDLTVQVNVK